MILQEALAHHGGQMAATARALDLERSHLYKKARALGPARRRQDEGTRERALERRAAGERSMPEDTLCAEHGMASCGPECET